MKVDTTRGTVPPARRAGDLARINAFGAAWMGVLVMPVYVPFLVARGLSVGEVLDLQAIYSVAVMLFEIPTGTLCDLLGRRRTILLAASINGLGFLGFAGAHGFLAYAAVQVVLAAAWSLVSGADVALIYDVLERAGADREARRRALGNYTLAQVCGEAAASLAGGVLAAWSLRVLGWVTAAETLLPLLLALRLPKDARRPDAAAMMVRSIPNAVRTVFRTKLPRLLFMNWIVWGLSTFIAVWLLQPYWQKQGVGIRWFGLLWAGTLVTVGITSRLAPALGRTVGDRASLLILAALPIAAYGGMALFQGTPGVLAGFLFYVSRGLNAVTLREAFNQQVPNALRATFNSLGSGASRFGYAVCGPMIGLVIDHEGLRTALAVLALMFLLIFLGLAVPLARRLPGKVLRIAGE